MILHKRHITNFQSVLTVPIHVHSSRRWPTVDSTSYHMAQYVRRKHYFEKDRI